VVLDLLGPVDPFTLPGNVEVMDDFSLLTQCVISTDLLLNWCLLFRVEIFITVLNRNDRITNHHHTITVLRPFLPDHPGEPVLEENFRTLWCMGRLTEAHTPTIWLSTTPSRLTSTHLHHPPFFTGRMAFLPPNQQCQSTEGNNDRIAKWFRY